MISDAYIVEDRNLATGGLTIRRGVLPRQGYLTISVPRDFLGEVQHQYTIYPFEPWVDRPYSPRGHPPGY